MRPRILVPALAVLLLAAAAAQFRLGAPAEPREARITLPTPPYPPRIADNDAYERCLGLLATDPAGASAMADQEAGITGDAALHCGALAHIALGNPGLGAAQLERLAQESQAPARARAALLDQAAGAWLLAAQPEASENAAAAGLRLAPSESGLLLTHAAAARALHHSKAVIADMDRLLDSDSRRIDALTLRAAAWREQDRLDQAAADIDRALALDPSDPEALLERGILRQRGGDLAGARADWLRARQLDPSSVAAELAEQNLALLEAGPARR